MTWRFRMWRFSRPLLVWLAFKSWRLGLGATQMAVPVPSAKVVFLPSPNSLTQAVPTSRWTMARPIKTIILMLEACMITATIQTVVRLVCKKGWIRTLVRCKTSTHLLWIEDVALLALLTRSKPILWSNLSLTRVEPILISSKRGTDPRFYPIPSKASVRSNSNTRNSKYNPVSICRVSRVLIRLTSLRTLAKVSHQLIMEEAVMQETIRMG